MISRLAGRASSLLAKLRLQFIGLSAYRKSFYNFFYK